MGMVPWEGAGLSCCNLFFETVPPISAVGVGLLWWVWGAHGLALAQHKLVPTLPTFEGSSWLKTREAEQEPGARYSVVLC